MRRVETIAIKNIPSKTPAPPIEINPGFNLRAFLKFKISAPIKVPKTPDIKAQEAVNSGAKIKAKIRAKNGGRKNGIVIPLPGTILAKNFEDIAIKKTAIKTGCQGTLVKK